MCCPGGGLLSGMCWRGGFDAIPYCLANEELGYVDKAVAVINNADAYLAPLRAQNIGAVAGAAHEGSLGFFHRRVMGNVFADADELIAKVTQHFGGTAIGGRDMCEVIILLHIRGFDAREAAKLLIQL